MTVDIGVLALCLSMLAFEQAPGGSPPTKSPEISAGMMEATIKIVGPRRGDPSKRDVGTGFLVARPVSGSEAALRVLVTAAHVFEGIQGETATLIVRSGKLPNRYNRVELPFKIRNGEQALWTRHPVEDIAVIYLGFGPNIKSDVVPLNSLAIEKDHADFQIQVGDEVLTVGYPNGAESDFGFGILRSGRIASHPLVPFSQVPGFLVDFSVFGGNSGGPVFMNDNFRSFGGALNAMTVFRVLGIVTQQMVTTSTGERLGVARVVHAAYIKEAIDLLPLSK